jgi:hypothetical protein
LCKKCDDIITCAGSGHHLLPDRSVRIIKEMPDSLASETHGITMHGPMNVKCDTFIVKDRTIRIDKCNLRVE